MSYLSCHVDKFLTIVIICINRKFTGRLYATDTNNCMRDKRTWKTRCYRTEKYTTTCYARAERWRLLASCNEHRCIIWKQRERGKRVRLEGINVGNDFIFETSHDGGSLLINHIRKETAYSLRNKKLCRKEFDCFREER